MTKRIARVMVTGTVSAAFAMVGPLSASAATSAPAPLIPTHACPAGEVPEDWMLDVPSSSWAESSVDCVSWWGVAQGVGASRYAPAKAVTRGQMALFLTRLITVSGGTLPDAATTADRFPDDDGTVYESADNQLAAAGVVSGNTQGLYSPRNPVTRGQMAKFLVNAFSYRRQGSATAPPPAASSYFPDVPVGSTFADFIMAAANDGFAGGHADGSYRPASPVTREQMAAFLTRVLEKAMTDAGAVVPPTPKPRPAVASYVADSTKVHLRDLAAGTDSLLYTAPAGTIVTATALSPDASTVAIAFSAFDPNFDPTPGQTHVLAVPAAGGAATDLDSQSTLADDTVDHLSWGDPAALLVTADDATGMVFTVLDPAGASPARPVTGPAAVDCPGWAEMLPNGAVLFSQCTDGVVLGSATGEEYGTVATDPSINAVAPSPDGQQLAYSRLTFDETSNTVTNELAVAPSVRGTPVSVTRITGSLFASTYTGINEVGWRDATTLLYTVMTATDTSTTPNGQIDQVAATAGATPTRVTLTGADQWGLSSLPQVG